MKAVSQIIQAIRASLKEDAVLPSSEKAAADYARLCEQAQQRLDTVALMLQKGSEYQALQAAEEEPSLLDFVGQLSFGDERVWLEFCDNHGLKSAPILNARTVRDLEAVYAKGISANHPLYKDFRAAVLSRDNVRSLAIVKTILKLNPGDENARQELQRLENKRLQETLDELRAALKTDDEEHIASLTETIKTAAPASKLERIEAYEQGDAIRRSLRKRQARSRVPALMAELEALRAEQNWKGVAALLETVQSLRHEHGPDVIDKASAGKLEPLEQYCQRERQADEKRRRFDRALKSFLAFVEEVETRLLTGAGLNFDEVAEKDELFIRQWKELEAFHLPVSADNLQRMKAAGQELRAKMERIQNARRLRNLALAAVLVVLLLLVGAVGLHGWKAWSITQELASYRQKQKVIPAEVLIQKLRKEEELLLRWPYLQAKIAEVDAWNSQARATEKLAKLAVQNLEDSFKEDKSSLPPAQFVRQMEDAKALVGQVADDLAPDLKNRMAALRTRGDLQMEGSLKNLRDSSATTLAAMEKEAEEELSFERSASQAATDWQDLDKRLGSLEGLLKPETEALQLPADIQARITKLRQRLTGFQAALDELKKAREKAAAATTVEAYKTALSGWQSLRFVETAAASKITDSLPSEQALQATLLTGGDEALLRAVKDDVSGRHMQPDIPQEMDRQTILSLMADTNLNEVWENNLSYYGGRRGSTTVWSQGAPRQSIAGDTMRWTGNFYEPKASERSVLFLKRDYVRVGEVDHYQGQAILTSRLSATSDFVSRLQLKRITTENGDRFLRPLLEVFDVLVKDKTASPLAKAYIMLRLEHMMALRPQAWGLHYCQSLQTDLRRLNDLVSESSLRSEDWLVPAAQEQWTAPLTEFFKSCSGRAYMKEAAAKRELLRTAAAAGLKYGGYVETDRTLVPSQAGRAAGELWALAQDGGKPILIKNSLTGGDMKSKLKAPATAQVLSPVFFIPVNREELLRRYTEATAAPGGASASSSKKSDAADSVFLTTPAP